MSSKSIFVGRCPTLGYVTLSGYFEKINPQWKIQQNPKSSAIFNKTILKQLTIPVCEA
jgi:hypothetical protein